MQNQRQRIVVANWKMNVLPSRAFDLVKQYDINFNELSPRVIICPPFTHLQTLHSIYNMGFYLGAQNCSSELMGAHTGEVAPEMLKDLNCSFVIIGHSESRQRNTGENSYIPQKIRRALDCGISVIYCCGEPMDIRNENKAFEWVEAQLHSDLSMVSEADLEQIIIAYEPIWAIGTGQHASPEQAQQMHFFIRSKIYELFGAQAEKLSILYGGSVTASNAKSLSEEPDIDGVLVGGSSLKPNEFKSICESF